MLIQNNTYQYTNPLRFVGGGEHSTLRTLWNKAGQSRDMWCQSSGMMDPKYGIPMGTSTPGAWILPIKGGAMVAYNNINSAGTVNFSLQMGRALSSSLLGSGTFGDIALSLITSMGTNIVGSGELSVAMKGAMAMASNMAGEGDITTSLGLIVWCMASISGMGYATDSTLFGTARMDAEISSEGELLTINNAARAVWQALVSEYLVSGTMGNALATASVGGIDLGALADAVRAEMDANSTKLARIQDKSVVATKQDVINASV